MHLSHIHELFLSFHPTSCISSCPSELTAEDNSSCDDSFCELGSWLVHQWAGGGRNTSTKAMCNIGFGGENTSVTGHFSRQSWLFSCLEGSLSLECPIPWRSVWLYFEIRHESRNLEKKNLELLMIFVGIWLIGVWQTQSCVLPQKGWYNLGLKCCRGRVVPLY